PLRPGYLNAGDREPRLAEGSAEGATERGGIVDNGKKSLFPRWRGLSLFLIVFFLIYGSIHAYALLKAKLAFGFGWGTAAALAPVLIALTFTPLIVHFLGKHGMEEAARVASWIGYTWGGLLFLFYWMSLAVDALHFVIRMAGSVSGTGDRAFFLSGKIPFLALVSLSLALGVYSFFEARTIRVERVRIATDKLPASTPRVRIAQISDVHLGLLVRHRKAEAIAEVIRKVDPDLLVSTGDLVDAEINHLEGLAEIFGKIRPPLGKYAVTGNHEFYAGIGQAVSFTQRAGFSLLRGETVAVGNVLRIAGVDDSAGAGRNPAGGPPETEVLGGKPSPLFTVLLKHRPIVSDGSPGLIDLQLSGHTHKGQIFPFRYIVGSPYPNLSGLFSLGSGFLYTSRGTGTWGPPMRFLSPPEVTVIEIERATPGTSESGTPSSPPVPRAKITRPRL
ncbi:MAG TPA: metallophosphoesterase, partial [Candidatus Deferrimicrobiaceae bacterium]|nr:metallophosphoesterase [Candidatus Deferrimicrobiaceae bacterium]